MNCPKCGFPIGLHGNEPLAVCVDDKNPCELTEAKALLAAQRKAAIECLKEYGALANGWRRIAKKEKFVNSDISIRARLLVQQNMRHISVLVRGYRKAGIL